MTPEEEEYRQLVKDYKSISQRVIDDLTKKSTYNRPMLLADKSVPIDVNRLIYDEGQRALVIYILNKRNVNPEEQRPIEAINKE